MILEMATIAVKPGTEAQFEAGVAKAKPLFAQAKGCHGFELRRLIEEPSTYRLLVQWETLENHIEDFRNSEAFAGWRELVSPFFASPAVVVHATCPVALADPHPPSA